MNCILPPRSLLDSKGRLARGQRKTLGCAFFRLKQRLLGAGALFVQTSEMPHEFCKGAGENKTEADKATSPLPVNFAVSLSQSQ